MNTKLTYLLTISGFIIALDQVSKIFIHTNYHLGQTKTIIHNFFNITYVRNPGAAFGFLAQSNPVFRDIFFLIIPPIAVGVILYILKTVSKNDKPQIIALSCIFGGAIGNYIDRLRLSYVIDWLDFHIQNKYVWPAFNVADISIVTGICLLFLLSLKKKKKRLNQSPFKELP